MDIDDQQDACYARGYFPPSIESGNRKFTSSLENETHIALDITSKFGYSAIFRTSTSLVQKQLTSDIVKNSDIAKFGQMGTFVFEPLPLLW